MSRLDDEDLDKVLRETLHSQVDSLVLTENFEQHVLDQLKKRSEDYAQKEPEAKNKGVHLHSGVWKTWMKRQKRMLWLGAGVAAMLFGLVTLSVLSKGTGVGMQSAGQSSSTGTQSAVQPGIALPSFQATLAPISSQNVTATNDASLGNHTSANNGNTNSTMQKSNGTASTHSFVALSKQLLTVHAQLYNSSNVAISGKNLQGMLFFLRQPGALSPVQESDWEYFVNGPNVTIAPHQSVEWSFTPNPTPAFSDLKHRYIHLVWFLRKSNSAFPALTMGTLPVTVSDIHETITGTGGAAVQFLRITARVTNHSTTAWDPKSALAMLFFDRHAGASLLGHGTYKYFDDVMVSNGETSLVEPGESVNVMFNIVGIPGTLMQKLPLRILLIARNQVGA